MIDDAEQRVETMIAEGLRIMGEAIAEHKPVAIMAAYSGGDDSIVSTHFAMSHYSDCFAFNADTAVGLAPARCHLAEVCRQRKWQLEIGRADSQGPPQFAREKDAATGKLVQVPFEPAKHLPLGEWTDGDCAYEERVLNYGFAGPSKHSMMYINLKERPIQRMIAKLKQGKPRSAAVLIVSGIRHDESSRRAGYDSPVKKNGGQLWVNPFYWTTKIDFEAYRDEFGLPRNPVKAECGISGECCCGAYGKPKIERPAYRRVDPAFADRLDALEARVRELFPWGWAESPPDWYMQQKRGQKFLFDAFDAPSIFQPMCVGCNNGRR